MAKIAQTVTDEWVAPSIAIRSAYAATFKQILADVSGAARVTIDDTIKMLCENETTHVPSGAHHRLENPGKIDLEPIEVVTPTKVGSNTGARSAIRHARR